MTADFVREVRRRADGRCEYCHIPEAGYPLPFHLDHIIARQHKGETVLANLALACLHCNRHKGPNIAGIDEKTGAVIRLFHPRRDRWSDHFYWRGSELLAKSTVGRVTIRVLAINNADFRAVRTSLMEEGQFSFD